MNYIKYHNIPKKSGGFRTVYVPTARVRFISKVLLPIVREQLKKLRKQMSQHKRKISFGLVAQKGGPYRVILRLLERMHLHPSYALVLDIKDFYPSITKQKIRKLHELISGTVPELAEFSEWLLQFTENYSEALFVGNALAQGFPLVPYVAEMFIELAEAPFVTLSKALVVRYVDNYYAIGSKDQVLRRMNAIKKMLQYFDFEYRELEVDPNKVPILGAWLQETEGQFLWTVPQEKYNRAPGWVKGMERFAIV